MPDTLGLRERLATVCLALGQKDEALGRYQEEIKAGRVTPTLRLALARLALDLGKLELAQSEAKKVQDENPRNARRRTCSPAFTRPAASWGRRSPNIGGPDVGQASRLQLRLRPGSLEGGQGARGLRRAGRCQQPAEARMERGREYYRHGELDKALVDFKEAATMLPASAEPLIFQGSAMTRWDSNPRPRLRGATRFAWPRCSEPHYRLGRQEMDHGHPTAAIDHFRKAIAKIPANAHGKRAVFSTWPSGALDRLQSGAPRRVQEIRGASAPDAPSRPEAMRQVTRLSSK